MSDSFRFSVSAGAALFYPLLLLCAGERELYALLAAVVFHESGHLLALFLLGSRVRGISLGVSGLSLDAALPPSPAAEAVCALAGPAAGLLWAGAAAHIGGAGLLCAAGLSALLSLYNLLPCLPLDGGRALLALTGRERLLHRTGALCAFALLAAALRWGLYLTLPPVLWLCSQQLRHFSAEAPAARREPFAPAGRSAPAKRPPRQRISPASVRGNSGAR